jgi:pimeloyl-ACP methyl ester carboxylesterase
MTTNARSRRLIVLVAVGLFIVAGGLGVAVRAYASEPFSRALFRLWRILAPRAHGGAYLDVNGVRIYYETFGSGPPVLVLHGGLGSIEDMNHQVWALARQHLVIAPDSRAHARSSDSDAPLSYTLMAEDMIGVLDALRVERAAVVGWSDGGIIGLDLAMRHADRVSCLVAISANFDPSGIVTPPPDLAVPPPVPANYARVAPDPGRWPVFYQKLLALWRTQPHYTVEELGRIRAPTLVMAGEFDAIRRDHTDALARAIPNAQEVIVPDGSHSALTERAGYVNARVVGFLEACERA